MLFMVQMQVNMPADMDPKKAEQIKLDEKNYAQALQRAGHWPHLWRVVGRYANVSIFEAADNDALHNMLSGLPMYPYMDIVVTPLAKHPSAI